MRTKIFYSLITALVIVSFFFACRKKEKDTGSSSPSNMGTLTGQVFAADQQTPVVNAKVFVDNSGTVYLSYTDREGKFTLSVPPGSYALNIQSGDGDIFRTVIPNVSITANQTINLSSSSDLLLQQSDSNNIAYIAGSYDNIEVIIDSLGYAATEITVSDLADLNKIQQYDAIFLNCGKSGSLDSVKYMNLQTFVEDGGSLYASDWAVEYLTGDGYWKQIPPHIKSAHPSRDTACYPKIGGFIDDATLCTEKEGPGDSTLYGASIVAGDIQTLLGKTIMDVYYDLGSWEVIHTVTAPWETLIKHNGEFRELAVRMNLTNQNNNTPVNPCTNDPNGWVTICHIPPGNPNNPITITINCNALSAHLAHGDKIGSCKGNGGNIYYTTFHNHPQGTVSDDVKKILEYFILNL